MSGVFELSDFFTNDLQFKTDYFTTPCLPITILL